ncbi:helix-turn-helix transcriptional regulator [Pedobacter aquae]|uniref:Helix-turn-helix transcriptional regulator n=1 Tax=Pedobacter aquae TaxID=2605747 RepID=A0A5C0VGD7_9SPHI|nr:helix-turn-helix transcriptional regulator [Pedobacter aquae]QEK50933.1 helix-turn-helix transcriptional regulator [Pedobacter aquae]
MIQKDTTEIKRKFGEKIQQMRKKKNLTLRKVAQNCDLDDSNISKIENGKFDVRLSTIFELAKGLGVEAKELVDFNA